MHKGRPGAGRTRGAPPQPLHAFRLPHGVQLGGDPPGSHSFRAKPQDPAENALLPRVLHEGAPVVLFDLVVAIGRTSVGAPLPGSKDGVPGPEQEDHEQEHHKSPIVI